MQSYKKFLESKTDHIDDIANIARDEGIKVERETITIKSNQIELLKLSRYDDMGRKMKTVADARTYRRRPVKFDSLVSDEVFLKIAKDVYDRLENSEDLKHATLSYYNYGNFSSDGAPDWPKVIDFKKHEEYDPIVDIFTVRIFLNN